MTDVITVGEFLPAAVGTFAVFGAVGKFLSSRDGPRSNKAGEMLEIAAPASVGGLALAALPVLKAVVIMVIASSVLFSVLLLVAYVDGSFGRVVDRGTDLVLRAFRHRNRQEDDEDKPASAIDKGAAAEVLARWDAAAAEVTLDMPGPVELAEALRTALVARESD